MLEPRIETRPDQATVSYRRLYRLPDDDHPILDDRITVTIRLPPQRALRIGQFRRLPR